ncbi:MAG: argininosuccinate lyase [Candidatus Omnitrophica bacterium]|nr:argininosuccinate lyase [Candidatus Omnitrophota bacterium]
MRQLPIAAATRQMPLFQQTAKKLWGGGYQQPTSKEVEKFTGSVQVDRRLALEDIDGSMAHAQMLGSRKIIPKKEARKIVEGLKALRQDWKQGKIAVDPQAEDIHSVLHAALEKKIGAGAQYLHTGRSRNDQVITDTRLYGMRKAGQIAALVAKLQHAILVCAKKNERAIVPGYTHLQHAQPVLFAHMLLAYCEALERDRARILAAGGRLNELPLGSGALAGTGLNIDRKQVAKTLGFAGVSNNSLDAVGARDGLLEIAAALAILGIQLSRIAEDFILWASPEYGFVRFDEKLLTGSSMMPQKQNPDFLELTRAGAGKLIGRLVGFLTICKGLPSGYSRDLQMDKEHLFDAIDTTEGMLSVVTVGFAGLQLQTGRIAAALEDESLYATDLAEHLVSKGVPFAQAHKAIGELMGYCRREGVKPSELTLAHWAKFSPRFGPDAKKLLKADGSVNRKRSQGSTNPKLVRQQLNRWLRRSHA